MKISDYYYDLPEERIAQRPPANRGSTRLLVLQRGEALIHDKKYKDAIEYLDPGDVLVLNDTKVFKARIITKNENGSDRELLILEKHSFDDDWHVHRAMYRGRLKEGERLTTKNNVVIIVEKILGEGVALVRSERDLSVLADEIGEVPLPPYMQRDADVNDVERYQTVWANELGSVAAPTASLNMTKEFLDKIKSKGVIVKHITLHVGLGTFLPIRSDSVENHVMHKEWFKIPIDTVDAIKTSKINNRKIVAVGTTVARTLEYSKKMIQTAKSDISGEADIFIYPGYVFEVVDALLTNFHAPRSTVLMLAAAFSGWDNLHDAYEHAIEKKYDFLSYGDSMLIL